MAQSHKRAGRCTAAGLAEPSHVGASSLGTAPAVAQRPRVVPRGGLAAAPRTPCKPCSARAAGGSVTRRRSHAARLPSPAGASGCGCRPTGGRGAAAGAGGRRHAGSRRVDALLRACRAQAAAAPARGLPGQRDGGGAAAVHARAPRPTARAVTQQDQLQPPHASLSTPATHRPCTHATACTAPHPASIHYHPASRCPTPAGHWHPQGRGTARPNQRGTPGSCTPAGRTCSHATNRRRRASSARLAMQSHLLRASSSSCCSGPAARGKSDDVR